MTSAQHMAVTVRHGSPGHLVDIARAALERIDFDPTSEPAFNSTVGAARYFTERDDATATPWFAGAPHPLRVLERAPAAHFPETVLCNPPGGLIKELWYSLCSYWRMGWISSAVWVGFNIEQLTYLQSTVAAAHPLTLPTLFLRARVAYLTHEGLTTSSPPHSSYLTLLSRDLGVRRRFVEAASKFGHVINQ